MSVANSYAKALYEASKEAGTSAEVFDQTESQLDAMISLLEKSHELKIALLAPVTNVREKTGIIQELGKVLKWPQILVHFMILLVKKDRLHILKEIREAFNSVRLTSEGGVSGRLVSAEPMNESDIGTLVKAFSHKLGKKVAFRVSTDPSLLAGMKVTVNGVTYDGTLRSQLQKLRDRFVAGLPSSYA